MIGLADATPEDAPALARIMGDWIAATEWLPKLHTDAEDVAFLRHLIDSRMVRVARVGGEAAGFLARQGPEVDALYVGEPWRSRGIGAALIGEAKAEKELKLWTFQANTRAIAFYLNQGFIETRRSMGEGNDEGLPDLRLEWRAVP